MGDLIITREGLVRELIEDIEETEFIPRYRQKKVSELPRYRDEKIGEVVRGWPARLQSYFWPSPACGYAVNLKIVEDITRDAKALVASLDTNSWLDQSALEWAQRVFCWGHVPQDEATGNQVREVFSAALHRKDNGAPLNSGWTKVAAFATSHLEDEDGAQVIWDSRVSNSLVTRLDKILHRRGHSMIRTF